MSITNVLNHNAILFLQKNKAGKEHISISSSDSWIGWVEDKELVGVVGIIYSTKKSRIKSFFVSEEWRKKGIGEALLKEAIFSIGEFDITAFATNKSIRLFQRLGFNPKWKNKNEITFLEREK